MARRARLIRRRLRRREGPDSEESPLRCQNQDVDNARWPIRLPDGEDGQQRWQIQARPDLGRPSYVWPDDQKEQWHDYLDDEEAKQRSDGRLSRSVFCMIDGWGTWIDVTDVSLDESEAMLFEVIAAHERRERWTERSGMPAWEYYRWRWRNRHNTPDYERYPPHRFPAPRA